VVDDEPAPLEPGSVLDLPVARDDDGNLEMQTARDLRRVYADSRSVADEGAPVDADARAGHFVLPTAR
jgi:hypothetical protein